MSEQELRVTVENALQEIRPYLEADGGNISLVEITKDTVSVQLEGACLGCSVNQMTLKNVLKLLSKDTLHKLNALLKLTEFHSSYF